MLAVRIRNSFLAPASPPRSRLRGACCGLPREAIGLLWRDVGEIADGRAPSRPIGGNGSSKGAAMEATIELRRGTFEALQHPPLFTDT